MNLERQHYKAIQNHLINILNALNLHDKIIVTHAMIDYTDDSMPLAVTFRYPWDTQTTQVIRACTPNEQISVWRVFDDEELSDEDPVFECDNLTSLINFVLPQHA